MNKLRPCPRCKGEPKAVHYVQKGQLWHSKACTKCQLETFPRQTEGEAREDWEGIIDVWTKPTHEFDSLPDYFLKHYYAWSWIQALEEDDGN